MRKQTGETGWPSWPAAPGKNGLRPCAFCKASCWAAGEQECSMCSSSHELDDGGHGDGAAITISIIAVAISSSSISILGSARCI